MRKIAVFASGSGTNAENIANYFANNQGIKVVLVISNNPLAGVHARITPLGIPSATFSTQEFAVGDEILQKLAEFQVDWIILAGFLKKIPDKIRNAYPDRIINIHPALLPKHGGQGMYGMNVHKAVIAASDKESGITIHYINENYDEGQIIFQASCPVLPSDTPEDVASKVHALEYKYYPEVIDSVLNRSDT
jgi:phosphoribosylglycinamide formyltransferase-1